MWVKKAGNLNGPKIRAHPDQPRYKPISTGKQNYLHCHIYLYLANSVEHSKPTSYTCLWEDVESFQLPLNSCFAQVWLNLQCTFYFPSLRTTGNKYSVVCRSMVICYALSGTWDLGMLTSLQVLMSAHSLPAVHLCFHEEGVQMQWAYPGFSPEATVIGCKAHICPVVQRTFTAGYK